MASITVSLLLPINIVKIINMLRRYLTVQVHCRDLW